MRSNCLFFALRIWLRRRGRGKIDYRKSRSGWFPHFMWVERHHILSFKPAHPVDRVCPPALFVGRVRWGDKRH